MQQVQITGKPIIWLFIGTGGGGGQFHNPVDVCEDETGRLFLTHITNIVPISSHLPAVVFFDVP